MKKLFRIEYLFIVFIVLLSILIFYVFYNPYELSYFVKEFKIPLYFVAGFIPVSGLIVAYQRMKQTEIQNNFINFENTFFNLVNLLMNYVSNLSHGQTYGRNVIEAYYRKITNKTNSYEALGNCYKKNQIQYDGQLIRSYLNMIHNIIKHINYYAYNKNPEKRINKYRDILLSTLSEYEIVIIMGYMISNRENHLTNDIVKIKLFQNVNIKDKIYNKILVKIKSEFKMI